MTVDFTTDRWNRVKDVSRAWWDGNLKRPLIQVRRTVAAKGQEASEFEGAARHLLWDESVPPEKVVECWERDLSRRRFYGDAFPHVWPNMGPGVIAAFMGADAHNDETTVWFTPREEKEISDIHFAFDPDNKWFVRMQDVCRLALECWDGLVQVGATDLGGNLDILSTFRPSEKLLLDLYDHPDDLKRLTEEAHDAWWGYYDAANGVLQPANPGYTAWLPVFSETPYYVLQCDFCYMISPDMFDEFVKPELAESCRRLDHAFYHLDGPGSLPHLDSLLSIDELAGIQWVFGAGQPGVTAWPEVHRRIREAGKLLWLSASPKEFAEVVKQLGSAEGLVWVYDWEDGGTDAEINDFLETYGAA